MLAWLVVLMVLFGTGRAHAAHVALVPADSSLTLADEFVMRVEASDVTDLKGIQFELSFDSSVLQVLSVSGGNMLPPGAAGSFVYASWSNAPSPGRVRFDAAVLTGHATGSGTLALVRFRTVSIGISPVQVATVELRDSANTSSSPTVSGSTIRVFGPVSNTRSSWTSLKARFH